MQRLAVLPIALLALASSVVSSGATPSPPVLTPAGIGPVQFGAAKNATVTRLGSLLGRPSGRFVNSGCSPRYTEVAWGDLVAEFRDVRLSGFRYLLGGWPLGKHHGQPSRTKGSPLLRTGEGTTVGDTLQSVRLRYGQLQRVGADSWRSIGGLVFVDNAKHDPVPPRARIVEIKIGTCGDF